MKKFLSIALLMVFTLTLTSSGIRETDSQRQAASGYSESVDLSVVEVAPIEKSYSVDNRYDQLSPDFVLINKKQFAFNFVADPTCVFGTLSIWTNGDGSQEAYCGTRGGSTWNITLIATRPCGYCPWYIK